MADNTPILDLERPDYQDPRYDLPINRNFDKLDAAVCYCPGFEGVLGTDDIIASFIYDTTQDSDLGAWRDRCESLSWYNEALNTSTRGATRKFPSVVFIVVGSQKVVIYDATVSGLSMWMVFNVDNALFTAIYGNSGNPLTSIEMKNGLMVLGAGGSAVGALSLVDFIKDETAIRVVSVIRYYSRNILGRNDNVPTTDLSYYSDVIINRDINDVAMIVLADAPVDDDTGLPVPTIAIATDGGVSVIDGPAGVDTVVDSSTTFYTGSVSFLIDSALAVTVTGTDHKARVADDYSTDAFAWTRIYSENSIAFFPNVLPSADNFIDGALSSVNGLSIIKEDTDTPTEGMVNYITDEYISGWQQGDIKMATLADGTEETIGVDITTEHIENGTFPEDVDWTLPTGWAIGSGILSKFAGTASDLQQDSVVNLSLKFRVRFYLATITGGGVTPYCGDTGAGTERIVAGFYDEVIQSTGVNNNFYMKADSLFAGTIDNISVQQVIEKITNGTFVSNVVGWTGGNGNIEWDAGTLKFSGNGVSAYGHAEQEVTTDENKIYKVTFDYIKTTHNMNARIAAVLHTPTLSATGTYSFTFKAITSAVSELRFYAINDANAVFNIDNVIMEEAHNLIDNGEFSMDRAWTQGTGWSIGSGVAACDGTQTADTDLVIDAGLVSGTYRLSYDVVTHTGAGLVQPRLSGDTGTSRATVGHYTDIITSDGIHEYFNMRGNSSFVGSVDNIVVEKVTLVNGEWLTADELISNGAFEGLTTDWETGQTSSLSLIEAVAGQMLISRNNETNPIVVCNQSVETIIGQTYEITFNLVSKGAANNFRLQIVDLSITQIDFDFLHSTGVKTVTHIPDGINTKLHFIPVGTTDNTSIIDDISVKVIQNIIANGEFSDTRLWGLGTGWEIAEASGQLTQDGTYTANAGAEQQNVVEIGKKYRIRFDLVAAFGDTGFVFSIDGVWFGTDDIGYIDYVHEFAQANFRFQTTATTGRTCTIEGLIVEELDVPDRSYNQDHLQVVGELTKAAVATGADLVEYSGFSLEDYIEQPYNSNMDVGTDDFYIMGWVNRDTAYSSPEYLYERALPGDATVYLYIRKDNVAGDLGVGMSGGTPFTGAAVLQDGERHFLAIVRVSGVMHIYVDGVEIGSSTMAGAFTKANAITRLGSRAYSISDPATGFSQTLWRMGAGAPSVAQIAEIYESEKLLFEAGAKFKIEANDPEIFALSKDASTGFLHVAAGLGTTVYNDIFTMDDIDQSPDVAIAAVSAVKEHLLYGYATGSYGFVPGLNIREELNKVPGKLDAGDIQHIDFIPQDPNPIHWEGRLFYEVEHRALSLYTDIAGVTHNLGQETLLRVINKTGVSIPNGKVCRVHGFDETASLPTVILAQANTFHNAQVTGVTTHDLDDDTEGFITTQGVIHDMDVNSVTAGEPIFLSATAGELTGSILDFASKVGIVLVSGANGRLLVNIENTITVPPLLGLLQAIPDTDVYTLSTTPADLDGYTVSNDIGITVVGSTGYMTLPNTGWYRATISVTVTVQPGSPAQSHALKIDIYRTNNTPGIVDFTTLTIPSSATAETGSRSATIPFQATAGDILVLQISSSDSTEDLTFDSSSFDIESISVV